MPRLSESDYRSVLDVLREAGAIDGPIPFRTPARRRRSSSTPDGGAALLTPREHEIIELVAEGKRNAEVARLLWISPGTVRKHLENAYEKLGVHTRTGAVAALRPGVATPASRAPVG